MELSKTINIASQVEDSYGTSEKMEERPNSLATESAIITELEKNSINIKKCIEFVEAQFAKIEENLVNLKPINMHRAYDGMIYHH